MGWTGINTSKSFEEVFKMEYSSMEVIKYSFAQIVGDYKDDDCDEQAEQFVVFKHSEGYKFIAVILWKRCDGEVLWKAMDESMGPYSHTKCPKEILDAADSIEKLTYKGYAEEWRKRQ